MSPALIAILPFIGALLPGLLIRSGRDVAAISCGAATLIAWGSAPFAGFIASFYTHEEDVKEVVKQLLWLNALFMPIWSLSPPGKPALS